MKLVFFDMEFANGKIPGSVYSFGYVQTNEHFKLTEPQTDLLMNPECSWNDYVRQHILAYPMATVKSAAGFPSYYKRIRHLLRSADLIVGFSVKNDIRALRKACERYGLKPIAFACLDMEQLCRARKDYPDAHGLDGYVQAYCGLNPRNRHRSDGDAYATMLLFREICNRLDLSPRQMARRYAAHLVQSQGTQSGNLKKASAFGGRTALGAQKKRSTHAAEEEREKKHAVSHPKKDRVSNLPNTKS